MTYNIEKCWKSNIVLKGQELRFKSLASNFRDFGNEQKKNGQQITSYITALAHPDKLNGAENGSSDMIFAVLRS